LTLWGVIMTVVSLFSQSSFDPEMTDILAAAFDVAWQRLTNSGSPLAAGDAAAATRETLAKNIIAVAKTGVRDKNGLVESALSRLAIDPEGQLFVAKSAPST
jgi:hypothetical protein